MICSFFCTGGKGGLLMVEEKEEGDSLCLRKIELLVVVEDDGKRRVGEEKGN